ncbi:MAG: phasin family protein [Anaerolineales bacterium]|nr:phasin family protein [Anaerolineales bacterium]
MSKTQSTATINTFGDLSKLVEQFKLPGVDMAAIAASRKKDLDALMAANQTALESTQTLARKQIEIFTQAMQSAQEQLQRLNQNGAVPDPVKQNELARKAFEKTIAQMKELAEMASKSQTDAMAGIVKRAGESAEEIRKLFQQK